MEFTCPCCQKSITENSLCKIIKLLKSNGCEYEATPEFPITFALPHCKWACDDCLENKKTVLADITQQSYSFLIEAAKRPFHLVYAPWESVCRRCKQPFEVSIEQQKRSYEVLKMPMRMVPSFCLGCEGKVHWSADPNSAKNRKPMSKRRLKKHIAASKAKNDLEKVQKYQLMLDKVNAQIEAETRKRIAEYSQNGEPTDMRSFRKLAELYQSINDMENAKKYHEKVKQLNREWWEANIKPILKQKSVLKRKRVENEIPKPKELDSISPTE